jgi:hypothetical protein
LAVVLYKYETQLFTLREEQMLKALQSGRLRKIFGTMTEEVTGKCWKLH